MIIGWDSSGSRPSADQARQAKTEGIGLWSGYLAILPPDQSGIESWAKQDFDNARLTGGTPLAFCSGFDNPEDLKKLAEQYNVRLCLDVEPGIRADQQDGDWVQDWLNRSGAGLYSNPYQSPGVFNGRKAPFYVMSTEVLDANGNVVDQQVTWETNPPPGNPGPPPPVPSGPHAWQWLVNTAGIVNTDLGLAVDKGWYDDWFATQDVVFMAWKGIADDQRIFWSATNVTQWDNQHQVPGVATSNIGPALAVFNGRIYMAWKGADDDQRIFWSATTDGKTWDPQNQVPDVGTNIAPALAVFNGRLYMAWRGTNEDERIYWTATSDGKTWDPQNQFPDAGSSIGPSLAAFNGRLYMAWKGIYGDERIFWSATSDGKTWDPEIHVPNVGSTVGPSLAVFNGRLYMAWRGVDGDQRIYWTATSDGQTWDRETHIPGEGSSIGPALAAFNGRLYMAWKGSVNDERIFWSATSDGKTWDPQNQVPNVGTSGRPALTPAAIVF